MSILKRLKHKIKGFTLTEVLLAVSIVGVIAALVLPATVTKFNDKVLDNAYTRNLESIKNAVDSLVVTENKASFFETSMYSEATPDNYENKSGKFLKRNFRISKYCGTNAADCFTAKYHKINGIKKEEVTPSFGGSCAILKSGAAICIKPQVGQDASDASTRISGYIDVNGIKGPNILDRDLRQFAISKKLREVKLAEVEDIQLQPNPLLSEAEPEGETPVTPDDLLPPDPCDDPNSLLCCKQYESNPYAYASSKKQCCNHSYISSKYPSQCGLWVHISLSCGANRGYGPDGTVCQDCDLLTENATDEYVLRIKYRRSGWQDYELTSPSTYHSNQVCVSPDLVGGSFVFSLVNSTTMETLDTRTSSGGYAATILPGNGLGTDTQGGYTTPEQDIGGPLDFTPSTGGQAGTAATDVNGLTYSYYGPPTKN